MSKIADTLSLTARSGLPDDLLFLARKHPRESWPGDPGLAGTGEVWLANHHQFREVSTGLARFVDLLREGTVTPQQFADIYRDRVGALLSALEGHHRIEDDYYFPRFMRSEPRLQLGFDVMEDDHHVVHQSIFDLSHASRLLLEALPGTPERLAPDAARAGDELAKTLALFRKNLKRHLDDEEDLVTR